MGGDYNNKLGGAYCIYNNDIVLAHLALEIPDGLANGTLLATFPNGVNLKTSLGIGVSSATGAISAINAIDNCIYSAGSMHTGNYILDMVKKKKKKELCSFQYKVNKIISLWECWVRINEIVFY